VADVRHHDHPSYCFSSRRRHTRSKRDWSSDVCSSDLGFMDYFRDVDADIFSVQEIKLQEGQIQLDLPGYYQYWNHAERKGYSGTAVFTKKKPLDVQYGLNGEAEQAEGRILTLEFKDLMFIHQMHSEIWQDWMYALGGKM